MRWKLDFEENFIFRDRVRAMKNIPFNLILEETSGLYLQMMQR